MIVGTDSLVCWSDTMNCMVKTWPLQFPTHIQEVTLFKNRIAIMYSDAIEVFE